MNKLYISILAALLLSSCGSWSEDDVTEFRESCMSQNKNESYCTCVLEKAQSEFSTFKEMTADENQEKMAEMITNSDCYEKKKEEIDAGE
ncbi:MAG: hypothetical protein ACI9N1_003199 [Flavobacteriales bacterium]|jgi:hypothetical protein